MINRVLTCLFSYLITLSVFSQETPKTLLWRITFDAGSKPSFLYGTMHSRDKRVYFLGDSVYSSLETTEGFAMEVDPGEYVDTMSASMQMKEIDVTYKSMIENDLVRRDADYYKKQYKRGDSILQKIRQRYRDLTPKDISRLEKVYWKRMKNDMKTLFDLYLFDIAKRQGKVVGGIEDIIDQTSITDELGNSFDPDEFLKNQRKKYADVEEWMIANYTAAELDKIHDFSKLNSSKEHLSKLLYNRNLKMTRRIDSLMRIRSTFFAIGAAHLPGDSGVISLLRNTGYTVTPVFSSKKIDPDDMKIFITSKSLINISDADSNYVVQMPGKPTTINNITDKLQVKTYKELSNEILLMHGLYEGGIFSKTIDKTVDEIKDYFKRAKVKVFSVSRISKQEINGYEMNFKNDEGYIRMHIFNNAGLTYIFAAGSKSKDSLNSKRCIDFLSTYKMVLNKSSSETLMVVFHSADKAFSVSMPVQPKEEHIKGDITYTREDVTLFSGIDIKKKVSYLVLIKEPYEGYFTALDSTVFKQTLSEVKTGVFQSVLVQDNIVLDGCPAIQVKILGENDDKDQLIYAVLVMRHNRLYNLTARGLATNENEKQFQKFIKSFRFLPYEDLGLETRIGGNNLFSVKAPSPVRMMDKKTLNGGFDKLGQTDYYTFDKARAVTYSITSLLINKYYWASSEIEVLNDYSSIYYDENPDGRISTLFDSVIYKKDISNSSIPAREILLMNKKTHSYARLRVMHYADSVFIISCMGNIEMVADKKADSVFNSFRFISEKYVTNVFDSKTNALITDLQSADTGVAGLAFKALVNDFKFPEKDIPDILKVLLLDYPKTTEKQESIPGLLVRLLPVNNELVIDFIRNNYQKLKGKNESLRAHLLCKLSESKSIDAYKILKDLLINDAPSDGNLDNLFKNLNNSANLAVGLYPELVAKISDGRLAYAILDLTNSLINTNKIPPGIIKEYEEQVVKLAKRYLKEYQQNTYNFYLPYTNALIVLLTNYNTKQSKAVINDFIDTRNFRVTIEIILARLRNNIPVSEEIFDDFCKFPEQQIDLYEALVKEGKQAFFRGEYANQKSFAKAFNTVYTKNQIPEKNIINYELVEIRDTLVNKILSRYYIFRVTCETRRVLEYYTSIIGPFSINSAMLSITEGSETYILYKQKPDEKSINVLFRNFIEQVNKMLR